MKRLLILVLFVLFNCKDLNQNNNNSQTAKSSLLPEIKYGNKFFEYNQLDYYHTDIKDDRILELYHNQDKSKIDKFKYGIITGEVPDKITDQEFLKFIEKIGYSKKEIDSSNFETLNKIFIEKPEEDRSAASCTPIFRDILIFKKDKKITGIAKICFSCHHYRIVGTNADTKFFGSDNDYRQLWKILNEK